MDCPSRDRRSDGDPCGKTAFEIMGREADGGQRVSDALTHRLAMGAVDDDGARSVEFTGPGADASGIAPRGTGNEAGRRREHVGSADVEHERWDGKPQLFDQL